MPANKNQHFVPRCYLKPFTLDSAGISISLYNLVRRQLINGAPVKNQCSRDYFYGKDPEIEEPIQALEQRYAGVVRRIVAAPGNISNGDAHFLAAFWIFQHLRTEAIQKDILAHSRQLQDALGGNVPDLNIGKREATLLALGAFAHRSDAIADLKVVLVVNRSSTPLLTSDNPAVQTNRWVLPKAKNEVATFGMHSAGAIALLPIAPDLLAMFYDKDIYSIEHEGRTITIRKDADIQALNEHQILNCVSNLYLGQTFSAANIAQLPDLTEQRALSGPQIHICQKKTERGNKYYAASEIEKGRGTQAMITTPTYYASPTSWPAFMKWRVKGFYFQNGSAIGHVRRACIPSDFTARPFRKTWTKY